MAAPRAEAPHEDHYHHAPDRTELEKALHTSREKLQPYTMQIVAAVLVALVLGVGAIIWSSQTSASKSAGWDEFLVAQGKGAAELEAVAEKHPATNAGIWARLQAGRNYLLDGLNAALTDRSLSDENLKKAKACFDKLLEGGAAIPGEVREEALYGLATSLEALSDGNTQLAMDAYEALLKDFPNSNHLPWVKARIEALKLPETKEFYAWFRTQTPQPVDRSMPLDLPTQPPPDDMKLPDINANLDPELLKNPIMMPDQFPGGGAPGGIGGQQPPSPDNPQPLNLPLDPKVEVPAGAVPPANSAPQGEAPAFPPAIPPVSNPMPGAGN